MSLEGDPRTVRERRTDRKINKSTVRQIDRRTVKSADRETDKNTVR